jgi:hypothetical protein
MTDRYDEGWQAAMKYRREVLEVQQLDFGGHAAFAFAVGLYALLVNFAWPYCLIRFGAWHPWMFMLGVGSVVWVIYLIRAQRRQNAKYREAKSALNKHWSPRA